MTFKELKDALAELDEIQLLALVELRADEVVELDIAQTFDGFPFFTFGRIPDGE